ncbi:MAG: hypothetical protein WCP31_02400 [Chloroflexales bacterium]
MIAAKLRPYIALVLVIASLTQVPVVPIASAQSNLAPTYRIFATREGLVGQITVNGHLVLPRDRFVALPSRSVVAPDGSAKFQVRVTYKGRSVVVPVWDVGPWNTQDDYWSPNRRYRDLPLGRPMAEAAYLDGYNGGLDEWGRHINSPNGIDIADGTFLDDLQMNRDDWVEVSFLWLGTDPGPGAAVTIVPPTTTTPAAPPVAVAAKPVTVETGAIAVDDGAVGYTPQGEPWSEAGCGLGGKHTWTKSTTNPSKATASATWEPQLPAPGFYELLAYIPECGGVATTSAHYKVAHDGVTTEVLVDQQAHAGAWASLGSFRFSGDANGPPSVTLSDLTDDNSRVVRFDALAWVPRTDTVAPDAQMVAIRRKDNGYQITWGGSDNMSGLATYDLQVRKLPKGGWTNWKLGVSTTSAWWGPDEGKHFAFRVRGTDAAGNQEPWPEAADMDTTQATP